MNLRFLKRLFGKKVDSISKLEEEISYRFKDRELIETALRHRSSLKDTGLVSNERLEFLGDAVLGMIVSNFLYKKNRNLYEGDLTRMKAALVNEVILSRAALSFNLGDYLYLSVEEDKSGGRTKLSITADAMEALIGAVFLDGDIKAAENLIKKYLLNDYLKTIDDEKLHNYKGELLEYLQARGKSMPYYKVVDEIGPDHDKIFKVSVIINNDTYGEGQGKSKKEAEQHAACHALKTINNKQ